MDNKHNCWKTTGLMVLSAIFMLILAPAVFSSLEGYTAMGHISFNRENAEHASVVLHSTAGVCECTSSVVEHSQPNGLWTSDLNNLLYDDDCNGNIKGSSCSENIHADDSVWIVVDGSEAIPHVLSEETTARAEWGSFPKLGSTVYKDINATLRVLQPGQTSGGAPGSEGETPAEETDYVFPEEYFGGTENEHSEPAIQSQGRGETPAEEDSGEQQEDAFVEKPAQPFAVGVMLQIFSLLVVITIMIYLLTHRKK